MLEANWQYTQAVLGYALIVASVFFLWFLNKRLSRSMNRLAAGSVASVVTFVTAFIVWYVLSAALSALH